MTVDALALLVRQVTRLRARAAANGGVGAIHRIYDLACGHGLLGVLLARRFEDVEVVCVDLERREGFEYYCEAMRQAATTGADKKVHQLRLLLWR